MKTLYGVFTALLMCLLTGLLFANLTGANPLYCILGCLVVSVLMGYANRNQPKEAGVLRAGLLKELWIDEITDRFFDTDDFLQDGKDWTPWVDNSVLNLADIGVSPNVVINRTVYPVPAAVRTDANLAMALTNYSTDSTIHRNIDQIALSYDKRKSIQDDHKAVLLEKIADHGIFNIAPTANVTATPVIKTSGAVSADTGNKILTSYEFTRLNVKFDNLKYPTQGRTLVVPPSMFWEFVESNSTLKAQAERIGTGGTGTGIFVEFMGWKIRPRVTTAYYNKTTLAKLAWGAVPGSSDKQAAVAYIAKKSFGKAMGDMDMFAKIADPDQQGDVINFLTTAIVLPVRQAILGAIVYSD